MTECTTCTATVDRLEVFPGNVCLPCWASGPGSVMPTAEQVVSMWQNVV